jgi:hypothetical protein
LKKLTACFGLGVLSGWLGLAFFGCVTTPAPTRQSKQTPREYPGVLGDSRTLGDDFFWRQRIAGVYKDRSFSFSAVVQLQKGTLTVLMLGPMDRPAFAIEQRGRAVSLKSFVQQSLPFPPRYVLYDIHRIYFSDLHVVCPRDGACGETRDGEKIAESWKNGKLYQRRFERIDRQPPGFIRVRYQAGMTAGKPPERIEYENEWYGYTLSIQTLVTE